MAQIVRVTKPDVIGLPPMSGGEISENSLWNSPELAGKSQGEIHDYFERLGCEAARRGMEAAKDAHEAWMHGWLMEMERADRLEHIK